MKRGSGPMSMPVVRAAHAFAYQVGGNRVGGGYSEKLQIYAFLVTVEGMEQCEARAIAYDTRVSHTRKGACAEAGGRQ